MSAAPKRGGRFSYLTSAAESGEETKPPMDAASTHETESAEGPADGQDNAPPQTDKSGGGGEGRSRTRKRRSAPRAPAAKELASVPKGQGRMRQERSQLNVRLPTTLKRQASAKAVLEGRDIGEVVEELLREYLDR